MTRIERRDAHVGAEEFSALFRELVVWGRWGRTRSEEHFIM